MYHWESFCVVLQEHIIKSREQAKEEERRAKLIIRQRGGESRGYMRVKPDVRFCYMQGISVTPSTLTDFIKDVGKYIFKTELPKGEEFELPSTTWIYELVDELRGFVYMQNSKELMHHYCHDIMMAKPSRKIDHADDTVFDQIKIRARAADLEMAGVTSTICTAVLPIPDGSHAAHLAFTRENDQELSYAAELLHKRGLLDVATPERREIVYSSLSISGMVPDGHVVKA